ncbi:MAG: tetratricopeptide repeat protein [Acidobacteria bacterium]|nr:tetratricopeptide repeat protein [Acidobacteriota bacterium]
MNLLKKNVWLACAIVAGLLLSASGCAKLQARDQLNKGVAFYKEGKYQLAIEHFKSAVNLDPTLLNAKLYLATAYANQYVPGSEQEENVKIAEQAISEFHEVLRDDPNNVGSITGIANLYFQMKRMDEAKEYYKRQLAVDPNNPEAWYSVGVIDWTLAYQPRIELKTRLKIPPDQAIKDAKERQALAERNLPLIEEGMNSLNKAIELRPDYDDAMAYLNLLYREKADLADSPEMRDADLKTADSWMDKTLEIKKQKAAKAPGTLQG